MVYKFLADCHAEHHAERDKDGCQVIHIDSVYRFHVALLVSCAL